MSWFPAFSLFCEMYSLCQSLSVPPPSNKKWKTKIGRWQWKSWSESVIDLTKESNSHCCALQIILSACRQASHCLQLDWDWDQWLKISFPILVLNGQVNLHRQWANDPFKMTNNLVWKQAIQKMLAAEDCQRTLQQDDYFSPLERGEVQWREEFFVTVFFALFRGKIIKGASTVLNSILWAVDVCDVSVFWNERS